MMSNREGRRPGVEHFVTLFDSGFLPLGLALHASLVKHAGRFHLWVVCMDQAAAEQIQRLAPAHVTTIALSELETPELLAAKQDRNRGEYCWTMTPFTFDAVFERAPEAARVTYLDADVFFFDDPAVFLRELEEAGRHVLMTEHAYDPAYDQSRSSGRFCVQFLTFDRSPAAREVLEWWQTRCLEWCYDRVEPDRFGDQKYLDRWPELFPDAVHILRQIDKMLAPWNVRYFACQGATLPPVMYHFHGFRLLPWRIARLHAGYLVRPYALPIYHEYVRAVGSLLDQLEAAGFPAPIHQTPNRLLDLARHVKRAAKGSEAFARLP